MAWGDGGVLLLLAGTNLLALFVEILPIGNHHCHVVMCLHHTYFLVQLLWIDPEIIAGTVGNICPSACQQTVEIVIDDALVLLVTNQADDVGMLLGIALADGSGVVGRAVFANDNLERHVALLHQDGVECPADSGFLIVGDDYDRYHVLHHLSFFISGRVVSRILRPKALLLSRRNQVYFVLYGWLGKGKRLSLRKSSSVSFSLSSDRVNRIVL